MDDNQFSLYNGTSGSDTPDAEKAAQEQNPGGDTSGTDSVQPGAGYGQNEGGAPAGSQPAGYSQNPQAGYQQNGYPQNQYVQSVQNDTYQQSSYAYNGYAQNGAYGGYQQNGAYGGGYQQNTAYQTVETGGKKKKEKKKRERKPGGFGTKLAKCAALAAVFGLVSGTVFEGVHLASGKLFGQPEAEEGAPEGVLNQSAEEGDVKTTPVSSTYVGTDVSDIVEAAMPSIVAITNVSEMEYRSFWGGRPQTYENTSAGSGIIVSQDNQYLYIVTNNHVVEGATSLTVTFDDSSTVSANVKGTDPTTDLAVLRVSLESIEGETRDNIRVATLGKSENLRVGEASIAVGNALGYGQSVTTGCISALNREVSVSDSASNTSYTAEMIQTDAAINPGNSGGALLNAAGEVIGINSVKYSGNSVEGIGYAIPISTAMPIIEDLITKEKVDEADSAFLGIAGVDVTDDVSGTYNMPYGIYVAQVTEGSAAQKAGIQKGDIVTKFDGKDISSMDELSARLQYYKAGTKVDVTIMRASNGEYIEQTLSVELGKKI